MKRETLKKNTLKKRTPAQGQLSGQLHLKRKNEKDETQNETSENGKGELEIDKSEKGNIWKSTNLTRENLIND